ncbi:MAG: EF-P lysine aminoacylase GenX [Deltaproteobacteria bacterium]|nr:MAG: EF-P lysine aminoacylase GenX [Deltaproteobacteria bacterium]
MAAPADPAVLQVLALRAVVHRSIRRFFEERDFVEVETPAIVPSPGLDVHLAAFEVRNPKGEPAGWLATSPEYQMKRLLSAGAERIFQLGRSYRADEHGRHHEREFTMLEWYRADSTSDDVIRDTEELVAFVANALTEKGELSPFSVPWQRLTVDEALQVHGDVALDAVMRDEERFFRVWAEEVQPRLGNERPVIVTDWPSSMASLARLKPNGMADRFEAFFRGVELCNGFGELTDAAEQRRRFERDQADRQAAGAPVYPIDERFLDDLERGMPESGGNALGVDRLLMLLLGADSIQAVMPFPEERL